MKPVSKVQAQQGAVTVQPQSCLSGVYLRAIACDHMTAGRSQRCACYQSSMRLHVQRLARSSVRTLRRFFALSLRTCIGCDLSICAEVSIWRQHASVGQDRFGGDGVWRQCTLPGHGSENADSLPHPRGHLNPVFRFLRGPALP